MVREVYVAVRRILFHNSIMLVCGTDKRVAEDFSAKLAKKIKKKGRKFVVSKKMSNFALAKRNKRVLKQKRRDS